MILPLISRTTMLLTALTPRNNMVGRIFCSQIDIPTNFKYLDNYLVLQGPVEAGYGRGSKKLGIPTANLPHFDSQIETIKYPRGVYFGWASVDAKVYAAVVNIGKSPTFVGKENPINIAEVHMLSYSSGDFYGKILRVGLVTYIRPEEKFPSFDALIKQINDDISLAKKLDQLSKDTTNQDNEKLKIARLFIERFLLFDSDESKFQLEYGLETAASTDKGKAFWAEIDHKKS
eukprot:gene371-678_t